ncbi:MAG TPA: 1-deoxy-D-xylulose-5-phosphate synthase, partial [Balneolaceae bacterium]|nr:1-deoxy-D-xylulose-5-phosphate synthase [Balneolaceae bacterium]
RDMMYTASKYDEAAWAIRYPRGRATGMEVREEFQSMEIGKGIQLREGEEVAVLSFGPIGKYATEAAEKLAKEGIEIGHHDMRFAKPLDTDLIDEVCAKYDHIITLEDGAKMGGLGSAVAEYISEKSDRPTLKIMGIPDRIVEHGTQEELYEEIGIDGTGIIETVKKRILTKV